jgi:hypothetical protein
VLFICSSLDSESLFEIHCILSTAPWNLSRVELERFESTEYIRTRHSVRSTVAKVLVSPMRAFRIHLDSGQPFLGPIRLGGQLNDSLGLIAALLYRQFSATPRFINRSRKPQGHCFLPSHPPKVTASPRAFPLCGDRRVHLSNASAELFGTAGSKSTVDIRYRRPRRIPKPCSPSKAHQQTKHRGWAVRGLDGL